MFVNIQFLRFWAAFAVLGYHFGPAYGRLVNGFLGPLFWPFLKFGFVGVDLFFVISGFVIWKSTERNHSLRDLPDFYLRRFSRVYLSYWPWLILMAFTVFVLRGSDPSSFKFFFNFLLIRSYSPAVLPISWTLTFELLFYIAFGLTFLLKRPLAAAVLIIWGLITIVVPFKSTSIIINPLIFEFSLGVVLGVCRNHIEKIPLPACIILMIIFAYLGFNYASSKDYLARALTFGVTSFIVASIAISLEQRGVKVHNVWRMMGDASYAMYLSHYVLLTLMLTYWGQIKDYPDLAFVVLTSGTLLISLLQSKYYDTPLMAVLRRKSTLRMQAAH